MRSPATRNWWPWILAAPLVVILCEYLAIAPIGHWSFLFLETPVIFAFLAATLAVLILPIVAAFPKHRKAALAWWLMCLVFLPITFGGVLIGKKIRKSAFHDLAARSKPLVTAIHKYSEHHGSPPASLDDLVPSYLSEIPCTGIMAYPNYEYDAAENAGRYEGNPWVLRVLTPSGGVNFDEFMYFPLHNYPDRGHGGSFERMGDWAYLHE